MDDFQNEDFDQLLARIQEESLRHYNEVELPRRTAVTDGDEIQIDEHVKKCDNPIVNQNGKTSAKGDELVDPLFLDSLFHKGKDAEGFHLAAGNCYIYPSNYPVRRYQADIIPTTLFHNTLVSLPTGLGKTFIAAVVMYNFYRWYPMGKVVFMAPTRPLVTQQMTACHDIMGIPTEDTVELTGSTVSADRKQLWHTKRVFYLTPQVMMNDLRSTLFTPSLIKCLVIDEAHRATKGYAYCQVVKILHEENVIFRLLALSATPGSDVSAVKEVIQNLHIEKLEVRSEDSEDVVQYSHNKSIVPIIVDLPGYLRDIWNRYMEVYDNYARKIHELKVLTQNIATLSKFQMLTAFRKFTTKPPSTLPRTVVQSISGDFTVCITLAHGRELLQTYGLRTFYAYFTDAENAKDRTASMTRLSHDGKLRELLGKIEKIINKEDGGDAQKYNWSHPKMEKLVSVVKEHFDNKTADGESTKIIIFCQYRLVVTEVFEIVGKFVEQAKPVMFIGQNGKEKGQGLPQKKQLEVMKMFRDGECNVLVATSVAEEGLDIGEVDLIISVETHRSPIRLVQRFGRTGRKRSGRCIVLLTSGSEVKKFNEVMTTHKNYTSIINAPSVRARLELSSPRMVPTSCDPKLQLLHIKVEGKKADKKKQSDIRNIIGKNSTIRDIEMMPPPASAFLSEEELIEVREELGSYYPNFDRLPTASELWPRRKGGRLSTEEFVEGKWSSFSSWLDWNNRHQKTHVLGHSKDTDMLVHLLKKAQELKTRNPESDMELSCTTSSTSLWTTVGAGLDKKNKRHVIKKTKNNIKQQIKSNYGLDIRNCMATAAEKAKIISQDALSGVWFNTPANKASKETEVYEIHDENFTAVSPVPLNDDDVIVLEDEMNDLLNDILTNCSDLSSKMANTCALSKNGEIRNTVKKYSLLPSGEYKFPSISSYLTNISELLCDLTVDDIKKCDIRKLPCLQNRICFKEQKETDQYCVPQTNREEDGGHIGLNEVSPTCSEPDFIGIDDILKSFDVGSLNTTSKDNFTSKLSVQQANDKNKCIMSNDEKDLSPILTQNIKSKVRFDNDTNQKAKSDKYNMSDDENGLSPILTQNMKRKFHFDNDTNQKAKSDKCSMSNDEDDLSPILTQSIKSKVHSDRSVNKNNKKFVNKNKEDGKIVKEKTLNKNFLKMDSPSRIDFKNSSLIESIPSPIIPCEYVMDWTPVNLEKERSDIIKSSSPQQQLIANENGEMEEITVSPIISCRNTERTPLEKSKYQFKSPILSGSVYATQSKIVSSTPKTVKRDLFKPARKEYEKLSKIDEVSGDYFKGDDDDDDFDFRNIDDFLDESVKDENKENDPDTEFNEIDEVWSVDQLFKNLQENSSSLKQSPDNDKSSTSKKLSYYLKGDSLYTVSQLVEKAIKLEEKEELADSVSHATETQLVEKTVQLEEKVASFDKNESKKENNAEEDIIFNSSDDDIFGDVLSESNMSNQMLNNNNRLAQNNFTKINKSLNLQNDSNNIKCSTSLIVPSNNVENPKLNLNDDLGDSVRQSQTILEKDNTFEAGGSDAIKTQNLFTDSPLYIPYESKLNKRNINSETKMVNHSGASDKKNNLLQLKKCNITLKRIIEDIDRNNHHLNCHPEVKKDVQVQRSKPVLEFSVAVDDKIDGGHDKTLIDDRNSSVTSDVQTRLHKKKLLLDDTSDYDDMPEICSSTYPPKKTPLKSKSFNKSETSHNTTRSSIRSKTYNENSHATSSADKSKAYIECSDTDSDVFIYPNKKAATSSSESSSPIRANKRTKKGQKRKNMFVESEAEVSGHTSSGKETSGLDSLDESFIDDLSSQKVEESMIHAKYLQSVKDPKNIAGGYKIPELSESVMARDVFSQAVPMEHDTYQNDSFCVSDESGSAENSMSILEVAEIMLEKQKKKKMKKRKRKRHTSSSGSETDFELPVGNKEKPPCIDGVKKSNKQNKRRRIVILSESE